MTPTVVNMNDHRCRIRDRDYYFSLSGLTSIKKQKSKQILRWCLNTFFQTWRKIFISNNFCYDKVSYDKFNNRFRMVWEKRT